MERLWQLLGGAGKVSIDHPKRRAQTLSRDEWQQIIGSVEESE